jgi:two-component system nitrogen regulation sensor histidine kinase NtrY
MINRHAAKLLDIDPKHYLGRPTSEVLSQEQNRIFEELLLSLKEHKASNIRKEVRVEVRGQQVPLQMSLSVLSDEQGKELGKVIVFDDLSAVQSAQRAAAWTEVARRIAHEIKNPLTPIRLAAQRLQRKFSKDIEDPAFEECTHMIINQVDDLKYLVNEFSKFARMPKSRPRLDSLQRVVDEALILFRQAHKEIHFDVELDRTLPAFLFDPEQIRRVITNLVDNAIAAVEGVEDPRVELKTSYDNVLKIVRLSVTDNGKGLPEHLRSRVFEPYVTTKRTGTGLGLAIVKRSVEDHNGFVRAFANQTGGSRFVVELPVVVPESSSRVVESSKTTDGQV